MKRFALPLLLLVSVTAAACASFQKGPEPLKEQLESLRLAQLGAEARLSSLEARLSRIERQGRLEAARQAAAEPAKTQEAPEAAPQAPAGSPEALYEEGLRLLREAGQPAQAKAVFERFLKENPGHPLVPNALYWSGETLYAQKDYGAAVVVFKEVAAGYPLHHKAPAALLKMGLSYVELRDLVNARDYLGRVERLYPDSEAAPLARSALQQLEGRLAGPPAQAGKEE